MNMRWPTKQKRALGMRSASLGIMEQAKFTFKEEWQSEENKY